MNDEGNYNYFCTNTLKTLTTFNLLISWRKVSKHWNIFLEYDVMSDSLAFPPWSINFHMVLPFNFTFFQAMFFLKTKLTSSFHIPRNTNGRDFVHRSCCGLLKERNMSRSWASHVATKMKGQPNFVAMYLHIDRFSLFLPAIRDIIWSYHT